MKYLVLVAALFLAGCADRISNLNYIMDHAIVQLGDYCSGSIISKEKKLILTANHCLDELDRSDVTLIKITQKRWDPEHKMYMGLDTWAKVIAFDADHDIAILQMIAGTPDAELSISLEAVKRGQRVYTAGNPLGMPMFLGDGILTMVDLFRPDNPIRYLAHSALMSPGNSGGALLNEDGELIGLTNIGIEMMYPGMYGPIPVPTGHYVALPIEYVVKFLKEKNIEL